MYARNLTVHLEHRVEPQRGRRQREVQIPSLQGSGGSAQSPAPTTESRAWREQEFTD